MNISAKIKTAQLLSHPFDQYQRYQDVRGVIEAIQSQTQNNALTILDVGGSPLALKFLSNYPVVTANIEVEAGVKLQADGARLPFADKSFDIVITVDTLEHVPAAQREAFINELLRVTGAYTILTGPFANGYNEMAETTLNDFLTEVVGLQHRFLLEHLQNGLPHLEECLHWISKISQNYLVIPSGYTHNWLPLMLIKHYLGRLADGHKLSTELDRLYNYKCYWSDHKLPSYRQVVVVAKNDRLDVLAKIKDAFEPPQEIPMPDLNGVIAMAQALSWVQFLEEQDKEIKRLQRLVSGYESGRFIRLMAKIQQLIRLIKG